MLPWLPVCYSGGDFVRITGGEARGRAIAGPVGLDVRPTASKIRQAFFNILADRVPGCRFLDICAGSGLMGLEALSRGAGNLIAVEESRTMARSIESNIRRLGFQGEVICGDLAKVLPLIEPESVDIIYGDPPYRSQLAEAILRLVDEYRLLTASGVLAIEHESDMSLPAETVGLINYDRRKYGQTVVSFYRRLSGAES